MHTEIRLRIGFHTRLHSCIRLVWDFIDMLRMKLKTQLITQRKIVRISRKQEKYIQAHWRENL